MHITVANDDNIQVSYHIRNESSVVDATDYLGADTPAKFISFLYYWKFS